MSVTSRMPSVPHAFGASSSPRFGPQRDDTARVSFYVRVETRWGDAVIITGSSEQLGGWAPGRGLRLSTDAQTYPVWRCSEPLVMSRLDVEYKVVIMRAPDAAPEWELLDDNRNRILPLTRLDPQVTTRTPRPHPYPYQLHPGPSPSPNPNTRPELAGDRGAGLGGSLLGSGFCSGSDRSDRPHACAAAAAVRPHAVLHRSHAAAPAGEPRRCAAAAAELGPRTPLPAARRQRRPRHRPQKFQRQLALRCGTAKATGPAAP